jgi:hypothetical protein
LFTDWDASYQVSIQFAKQFQGRRFLKIDQSETRIACGSHAWQRIRTKLAILIEDASYQASVHLVKWFQRRRFFRNQPIRKKNGLWRMFVNG